MQKPLISISTDFGPGNKGIGVMKAVILGICPDAEIIELANDIPGFDLREGARLLEAAAWLPVGIHICVVDPGVGTARRGIVMQAGRGDFLVGPDNGVLLPVTRFLGGVKRVYQIMNEQLMRKPVSPVFHGRDVFAPVAAHLACGIVPEEVGPAVPLQELVKAPYEEEVNNPVPHPSLRLRVRAQGMPCYFRGNIWSWTCSGFRPCLRMYSSMVLRVPRLLTVPM